MRAALVLIAVGACGTQPLNAPDATTDGPLTGFDAGPDAGPDAAPVQPPALLTEDRVELWLDATSSLTTANGTVSRWVDRSSHHHDATQATAGFQPVLESAGIAGMPTVTFDGVDDQLVTAGFVADQSYTVFAVFANRDATVPSDHVASVVSTLGCTAGAPGVTLFAASSAAPPNEPGVITGTAMGLYLRIDQLNSSGGISGLSSTAGIPISKDSWAVASVQLLPPGLAAGPEVSLGAFRDGCQFGHVSIAEVIVVSSGVAFNELTEVEKYLTAKWHVVPGS